MSFIPQTEAARQLERLLILMQRRPIPGDSVALEAWFREVARVATSGAAATKEGR